METICQSCELMKAALVTAANRNHLINIQNKIIKMLLEKNRSNSKQIRKLKKMYLGEKDDLSYVPHEVIKMFSK